MMNFKKCFLLFCVILSHEIMSQSLRHIIKNNNQPLSLTKSYRHTIFAKIDLVREFGIGYNIRTSPYLDIELGLNYISRRPISGSNDYFFNHGYSISITPKLYGMNRLLYIGYNFSYLNYGYQNEKTEAQIGTYNPDIGRNFFEVRDRLSIEYAAGPIIGANFQLKQMIIQPFININFIYQDETKLTIYEKTSFGNTTTYNSPIVSHYDLSNKYYACIGLKIGYGLKKIANQKIENQINQLNELYAHNDSVKSINHQTNKTPLVGIKLNYMYRKGIKRMIKRNMYFRPNNPLNTYDCKNNIIQKNKIITFLIQTDSTSNELYKNFCISNKDLDIMRQLTKHFYLKSKFKMIFHPKDTLKQNEILEHFLLKISKEIEIKSKPKDTYKKVKQTKRGNKKIIHL